MSRRLVVLSFLLLSLNSRVAGQQTPPPMQHVPGMVHSDAMQHDTGKPIETGQSAFAAISEVVRLLEADPMTDWSKVNIEALRQHLTDMDAVTLRSRVVQVAISGGLTMNVTGDAATAASIRRMVTAHAPILEQMGGWRATTASIPGGIRLAVTAANPRDTALIARIRGLGFIGLMTEGSHHAEHHLLIARGAGAHAHGSP